MVLMEMGVVDLDKLAVVADGDGDTQVRVTKRWLQAAYVELVAARAPAEEKMPFLDLHDDLKAA